MGDWTRVVVGIDGSDNSKSALQWAAEEARTHGAELTVVSVWTPLVVPGPHGNVGWATQLDPEAQARDTLQATLDDTLGGDPGVGVRREVRGGNAAKVLIDLSEGADALVIGARGQGGFVGLLLGSVSQHVATNATCTVVVVR